jgi:small subunit ribosomal protein S1
VLRLDDDQQKISLGLKQLTDDPWASVQATYEVGQVRRGRITRVAEFGAFVELEPGIEGLIPLSETGVARDANVKRAFPVGTDVEVVVLEIDAPARRMRLSMNAVLQAREVEEVRDYAARKDAAPTERFGSLADKLRGALEPRE